MLYFLILACSLSVSGQAIATTIFAKADSLFLEKRYSAAKSLYSKLLPDTSSDALHLNRFGYCQYATGDFKGAEKNYQKALMQLPSPPLKASILSRLARVSAIRNKDKESIDYLDSAISSGYIALNDLDTLREYVHIRQQAKFKKVRDRLYNSLYPCMNNAQAREFDFWIGEWNVYITGTNVYAGHSLVQKVSGGCAILENWNSAVSEGKSLNFIDDSTKRWKQVWVGSYSSGKQDFVNGEYKDSAMRFNFETVDAKGNTVNGRFTFFNEGNSQVRQLNETYSKDSNSWTAVYDLTYIRKK